jgi:hypothetical protein
MVAMAACGAQDRACLEWVRWPPASVESEWAPLALADVHEVSPARQAVATEKLAAVSYLTLSQSETEFFSGYRGPALGEKKAFLVRAVFGHQGTGAYRVFRRGNDLFVRHASLGHSSPCHKGALVLNLDFTPGEVYVAMSVAE